MPRSDGKFKPLIVIAGPTASGKTALSLGLASRHNGIIINGDSMQVYRDLHILTARPSPEEERAAPHRLYGVLDAGERCSAGRWQEMAMEEISKAWQASQLPILVGGTGLYIKALLDGLSAMPDIPLEEVRRSEAKYDQIGGLAFRDLLAEFDPETAQKLPPGDRQRLVRAHSIWAATGRSLTDWHKLNADQASTFPGSPFTIVLMPDRKDLYPACDARFDAMMSAGALDEVRNLAARNLDPSLPALQALGVKQLTAFLSGEMTEQEAIDKAKQATRNYAKRQMTWFRHQLAPDVIHTTRDSTAILADTQAKLDRWLKDHTSI